MDTTLQSHDEKRRDENTDITAVVAGMFSFVVRVAKRIANSTEEELSTLKELATLFPKASETERVEIVETMMEHIFPQDHIGGIAPRRLGDGSGSETTKKCREAIGRRIAQFRSDMGMTQEELADKAGIPQSHVSRLETGRHTPTHVTIEKVAAALGVHPSKLDMGYPEEE
jgi:DNA-binding XRE family transcriptional regulator